MTKRNFKKELYYSSYMDMENGNDIENIDYDALIDIITELCDRIEELEVWKERAQSSAKSVREHIDL
jgi:transcription elongation GreA/GreB family factor